MRVLICGSRYWTDAAPIKVLIDGLPSDTIVIHGAAPGADTVAGILAGDRSLGVMPFPAHWRHHGCVPGCDRLVGPGAGPVRNRQMLEEGQPDIVHAFHKDLKRSYGTANMITQARNAGVEVVIHD